MPGGCYDSSQHSFILPDDLSYLTLAEDRVQATPLSEFLVFYLFPGLKSYWDQSDRFHSSNGADTFINMFLNLHLLGNVKSQKDAITINYYVRFARSLKLN